MNFAGKIGNIMKILFGAAALFTASVAMGAFQYNWSGDQGWLTFDSVTSLSSSVTVESPKGTPGGRDYIDYGWYNLSTGDFGSLNNGLSATFTENDRIGLWVKDNAGDVYLSTKPGKSAAANIFWGKTEAVSGGYSVSGGNFGSNGTQEYYVFKVNYGNDLPASDSPSGQPLPGLVATLLAGSGALIYLKRKRLRAAK